MFSWRARRQLLIFFIVIAPFVAGGIYLVERSLPSPTCFDKKQNQSETGIDCGGSCIPCSLKYPKPLTVFWARAVPTRQGTYDLAAEIENPNELLSSTAVDYEFSLVDSFGQVAKKQGRTFLYAQERTLIIETNLQANRPPTKVEFKVLGVEWQVESDPKPNIVVERRDYQVIEETDRKFSQVLMTVTNSSAYDYKSAEINVAALDGSENLLGANRITIENLKSGERRTVKSLWPGVLPGEPATIRADVRVNIFDPNTILKPQ